MAVGIDNLGAGGVNPDALGAMSTTSTMMWMLLFFAVFILLMIGFYFYFAITLLKVAKRTKTEPAWLAWIPGGNMVLMAKIAKMHWWPILLIAGSIFLMMIGGVLSYLTQSGIGLFFIILGFVAMIAAAVFFIIWQWKICESRNRPGWWALLSMISLGIYLPISPLNWVLYAGGIIWSFVMWGILAWGKD